METNDRWLTDAVHDPFAGLKDRVAAAIRDRMGGGADVRIEGDAIVVGGDGFDREYGRAPFIIGAIQSAGGRLA